MDMAYIYSFLTKGYKTAIAGTTIDYPIPAVDGQRLALIEADITCSTTVHTLSVMYPGSSSGCRNTCNGGAAAGQAVVNVTNNPLDSLGNAAAASDIVAYQLTDGTWEFNTVASVVAKAVTMSNNLVGAIAAGGRVVFFGVVGDGSCYKFKGTASAQKQIQNYGSIVAISPYSGDPMYVTDDNVTAAGSIDNLLFANINK